MECNTSGTALTELTDLISMAKLNKYAICHVQFTQADKRGGGRFEGTVWD